MPMQLENETTLSFESERRERVSNYPNNRPWRDLSDQWMSHAFSSKYMYNFSSLGRPIIQTPIDMVALQELIWTTRPDLIIETGIAHGGSLILSASMLALLDYCEAAENGEMLDPRASRRRVLGVDIDIRSHNRAAIIKHPLSHLIEMIQGSSIDSDIIAKVHSVAATYKRILVILDSNHTHNHVLAELEAYAPLTSLGSYCVVFDTVVEDLPADTFPDRPWNKGDNPKTAVWEYQRRLREGLHLAADGEPLMFEVDSEMENKLLITVAPDGYLKRI
ncbi:cephalosporin hydroxylase family protein [Rhodanobacter sp. L36]|uniref:cephalosporin hydroxylase family protein n=1 Tax=Rhodanobacter sp. L36 TaxID=1747221 RepID=UPI0020B17257|nr:cephalosporin hydroxylase family protein [Rhodanobacter sp. L36]